MSLREARSRKNKTKPPPKIGSRHWRMNPRYGEPSRSLSRLSANPSTVRVLRLAAGLMFGAQTNAHFHHRAGGGVSRKKREKERRKNHRRFSDVGLEECCVSTRINPVGESFLLPFYWLHPCMRGAPNHFQVLLSFFHSCRIWKPGARDKLRCFLHEFI